MLNGQKKIKGVYNILRHVKIVRNPSFRSKKNLCFEHSHAHLFIYCIQLLPHYHGRVEWLQQRVYAYKTWNTCCLVPEIEMEGLEGLEIKGMKN